MVDVFHYDAFQKTLNPEPEGGPLIRYSDYATLEAKLAERVKVKSLEWAFGETKPSPDLSVWLAGAPGLNETYSIWHSTDPNATAPYTVPSLHNGFFDTLDEAKVAAQADYDLRILAALEATPPVPKVSRAQAELIRRIVLPIVGERSREVGDAWDKAYHILDALTAAQEAGKP